MIPTYMEIEGNSKEEVMQMVNTLEIDTESLTALNCDDIYSKIYGIDISKIKELKEKN